MSAEPAAASLGNRIKGPTALGSDPRRFWHLTRALATTEFKLRFFGTALGYLWSLLRPLLLFGVLLIVFTKFLHLPHAGKYYAVALLLGIVLYGFFSEATGGALTSLVDREPLMRKIEFPRLAVPLSTVLTALFSLALNLLPVFVFLLAMGGRVRWTWLELPVLVLLLGCFATGFSMLLSALFVRYRDVRPIWDVVLQVMFYASPIFYPVQSVAGKHVDLGFANINIEHALMYNPFAAILQQARYALIDPSHPSAGNAIGGVTHLAIPIAVALGMIAVGYWVFAREAPRIAERL